MTSRGLALKRHGRRLRCYRRSCLPLGPAQTPFVVPKAPQARAPLAPLGLAVASLGVARVSSTARRYFGGFKPVVCERDRYCNDCGYLPDGTPMNQAGNKSLRKVEKAPKVEPVAEQTPLHGINFGYAMQKDSYADLEFLNDVGCSTLASACEPLIHACFCCLNLLATEATCQMERR